MPTLKAASESPAIKPPPNSDMVLMSAGSVGSDAAPDLAARAAYVAFNAL